MYSDQYDCWISIFLKDGQERLKIAPNCQVLIWTSKFHCFILRFYMIVKVVLIIVCDSNIYEYFIFLLALNDNSSLAVIPEDCLQLQSISEMMLTIKIQIR